MSLQPSAASLSIVHETPEDAEVIETLLDHAFGPGRFVKSSERVREFAEFRPDLSFCAWDESTLAGSVRNWLVRVGETPLIFLGPLAVFGASRNGGVGGKLVEATKRAAAAAGLPAILLVGDEPYFQRFGFSAAPAANVIMPAPVDQRRVLLCPLREDATDAIAGRVGAP
jgi:predicted N-acetyltransferase YhbS